VKIKIVKCSHPFWWYHGRVGQLADVTESHDGMDYIVKKKIDGETGYILKTDCEIVEDQG